MNDVIREYLVGLGFSVDNTSYNQMIGAMGKVEAGIEKFKKVAVVNFATAAASVVSFVAIANASIYEFLETLAKADLENQKFARKMWMNPENARAMQSSLKALDAEIEDLYYSPELLQRFIQLKQQANEMQTPAEMKEMYKFIRSITFEFQRFKLEATYAMQWIGYYLIKYLFGPLDKFKFSLKEINDKLVKSMPQWTKIIAQVISWFVRLGDTALWVFSGIMRLLDSIPDGVKKVGVAFVGLNLLLKTGPVGLMITALSSLLVLLEDYKTFKSGGESQFEKMWQSLDKFYNTLKDDGVIDRAKEKIDSFVNWIRSAIEKIVEEAQKVWDSFSDNGGLQATKDTFNNLAKIVKVVFGDMKTLFTDIFNGLNESGAFKSVINGIGDLLTNTIKLLSAITGVVSEILGLKDGEDSFRSLSKVITTVVVTAFKALDDVIKSINWGLEALTSILDGSAGSDILDYFKDAWGYGKEKTAPKTNENSSYLWGGMSGQSSNSEIKFNPTYNVYTTQNPEQVGKSIAGHTNDSLIRALKGGKH